MITVYKYIAEQNPTLAHEILDHFGYEAKGGDMGDNLEELVAIEGEPALKLMMNNHPDKDVILEFFQNPEATPCETCKEKKIVEKYIGADGFLATQPNSPARMVENNFSVIFLAGITILAVAIIRTKN